MNKAQLIKHATRLVVAGGFAALAHRTIKLDRELKEAVGTANTMSGMFGSLAIYVGDDVVEAWADAHDIYDADYTETDDEGDGEELEVQPIPEPATDAKGDTVADVVAEFESQDQDARDIEAGVDPVDVLENSTLPTPETTYVPIVEPDKDVIDVVEDKSNDSRA